MRGRATGKLVREVKVGSEPECLVGYFAQPEFPVERIGLEAGPLSQWLYAALAAAGHEVVLLETRHAKAALSAMTVKTDRKDARGIAQLLRMGGIVRSTPNRRRRKTLGLYWWVASLCSPSCSTSSSASGVSCAATD